MTIPCLAHQPSVLVLDVLGQQVLLLHHLDQPPDGRGQPAGLIAVAA
jgi:hypothetical protein